MRPNVVFVNLPNIPVEAVFGKQSSDSFLIIKKSLPLGILYLSSFIKERNELGKVGIIDYVARFDEIIDCEDIDEFIVNIAEKSINFVPDVILVSLIFSVSHNFCMKVIRQLKELWQGSLVLIGGMHATNYADKLLENRLVDFVALGEGEIGLSEFLRQYARGEKINVRGIYSHHHLKQEKSLQLCEFIFDLDIIPFPDWELVDMEPYLRETYVTVQERKGTQQTRSAAVLTTRGCPGQCTFCAQHTVHGRRLRYRSVDNVIGEMKLLNRRYGVTTFVPNDDMFLSKKERDLELLRKIHDMSVPGLELQFPNALHTNSLYPEIIDALIDAGTKVANIAIESGSEYVQRYVIKKNVNLKKASTVVSFLKQKGIYVRCFFILGLPRETRQQMFETIKYAESLNADWCDFFLAIPLIGSEIYEKFAQMGYIDKNKPDWSEAYVLGRNFDTEEISAKELRELAYRANLECNFISNSNKKEGRYGKAISLFDSVISRYPFHVVALYAQMECYEGLGERQKAEKILRKIKVLIKTNSLAKDMYLKYSNLMPNLNFELPKT